VSAFQSVDVSPADQRVGNSLSIFQNHLLLKLIRESLVLDLDSERRIRCSWDMGTEFLKGLSDVLRTDEWGGGFILGGV
jgi:hypothetical protein